MNTILNLPVSPEHRVKGKFRLTRLSLTQIHHPMTQRGYSSPRWEAGAVCFHEFSQSESTNEIRLRFGSVAFVDLENAGIPVVFGSTAKVVVGSNTVEDLVIAWNFLKWEEPRDVVHERRHGYEVGSTGHASGGAENVS